MSYIMEGTEFVREFKPAIGNRDKYYVKRFGGTVSTPADIGVPKVNGLKWDKNGRRVFVTITDDKETPKEDVTVMANKLHKTLMDKGIRVFENGNGGQG